MLHSPCSCSQETIHMASFALRQPVLLVANVSLSSIFKATGDVGFAVLLSSMGGHGIFPIPLFAGFR